MAEPIEILARENDAEMAHLTGIIFDLMKAMKQIEEAAHKASLTPAERLQDIRIILSRVGGSGT